MARYSVLRWVYTPRLLSLNRRRNRRFSRQTSATPHPPHSLQRIGVRCGTQRRGHVVSRPPSPEGASPLASSLRSRTSRDSRRAAPFAHFHASESRHSSSDEFCPTGYDGFFNAGVTSPDEARDLRRRIPEISRFNTSDEQCTRTQRYTSRATRSSPAKSGISSYQRTMGSVEPAKR